MSEFKFVLRSSILPLAAGFVPIAEQAASSGRNVPIGKTAKEIREIEFNIDPSIQDDAILIEEPNSPTGLVFACQSTGWALVR